VSVPELVAELVTREAGPVVAEAGEVAELDRRWQAFESQTVTEEQLMEAICKAKAARRATTSPQRDGTPAPVAEETQLAPEQLERINRACNDYVASLPAEDKAREPGPRITML
jgi:hypothetical protein